MEKRIGFVGCYSHDVILMLAKVFGCLEKKVLVRDRNPQHTLRASIPLQENLCAARSIVEYDGFFFTEQDGRKEQKENYDVELVDFGMEVNREEGMRCTVWIVITDMLLHHIRRLGMVGISRDFVSICIMRDSFEDECMSEPEVRQFLQMFPNKKEYFLPPDVRDVRNRYVCETQNEYNVNKASPEMQDMIYRIAGMFCTEYSEKEIRRNVKRRERRQYR